MDSNTNDAGSGSLRERIFDQQQELIFNNSADLTFLLGVKKGEDFRFLTVNNAFLNAASLTREKVEGKYAHEVIPADLYPAIFEKYNEAIRERQTVQWEDTSHYPGLGLRTGIISITPLFDEQGECNMLVGSLHDITERKKAEEAIRLREKQLALIYNTVGDIIFLLSVEPGPCYRFTSVNNSFLTTTGLSREQVEGKYVEEIIPMPSLAFVLEKYAEAIQYSKPFNGKR
jgi:PAS domain S-box-containing protein